MEYDESLPSAIRVLSVYISDSEWAEVVEGRKHLYRFPTSDVSTENESLSLEKVKEYSVLNQNIADISSVSEGHMTKECISESKDECDGHSIKQVSQASIALLREACGLAETNKESKMDEVSLSMYRKVFPSPLPRLRSLRSTNRAWKSCEIVYSSDEEDYASSKHLPSHHLGSEGYLSNKRRVLPTKKSNLLSADSFLKVFPSTEILNSKPERPSIARSYSHNNGEILLPGKDILYHARSEPLYKSRGRSTDDIDTNNYPFKNAAASSNFVSSGSTYGISYSLSSNLQTSHSGEDLGSSTPHERIGRASGSPNFSDLQKLCVTHDERKEKLRKSRSLCGSKYFNKDSFNKSRSVEISRKGQPLNESATVQRKTHTIECNITDTKRENSLLHSAPRLYHKKEANCKEEKVSIDDDNTESEMLVSCISPYENEKRTLLFDENKKKEGKNDLNNSLNNLSLRKDFISSKSDDPELNKSASHRRTSSFPFFNEFPSSVQDFQEGNSSKYNGSESESTTCCREVEVDFANLKESISDDNDQPQTKNLTLFVQGHSDICMLLLCNNDLRRNKDMLHKLMNHAMVPLASIEAAMLTNNFSENKKSQKSPNFLTLEVDDLLMSRRGNLTDPMPMKAVKFSEEALRMNSALRTQDTKELLYCSQSMCIKASRNGSISNFVAPLSNDFYETFPHDNGNFFSDFDV